MASNLDESSALWDEIISQGTYNLEMPDELVIRSISMFKREGVKKILDLGCGLGRHTHMFVERGYPVLGVDIAFSALAKTQVIVGHYPLAYLVRSDGSSLALRSDQFCLTMAWRMLHLNTKRQIEKTLEEIHRVLRPNGIIMCSVRSTSNTLYFEGRSKGEEVEPNSFIMKSEGIEGLLYHFFTREEVEKMFSKWFRLENVEEQELEHTCYTASVKEHKNMFWIMFGRKKS